MSDQTIQNKVLMRRVYNEMWNQARATMASELFERPEGVEKFVHQFLASFPDLQHSVEETIAEGDRIAVRFTARGTHTGPWLHFAATGYSIEYTGVTLARIVRGKIAGHQTWWDRAGLIDQIAGSR